MYFAKFIKIQFYILTIRYISQKCIIFASNLKNGTKLLKKIHINKFKLQNYEKSQKSLFAISKQWI